MLALIILEYGRQTILTSSYVQKNALPSLPTDSEHYIAIVWTSMKMSVSHGDEYEDGCLLRYCAV
jgi:hypothetical protein